MSNDYTITIDTSSNISTHTSPSTVTISGIDYDQGSLITDTGSEYINNITYSTSSSSLNTVTLDDTHWGDSIRWDQTEFVDTMPNLEKIEDMCKEYPALNKAYENFRTIYKMTLQDYKGKQND